MIRSKLYGDVTSTAPPDTTRAISNAIPESLSSENPSNKKELDIKIINIDSFDSASLLLITERIKEIDSDECMIIIDLCFSETLASSYSRFKIENVQSPDMVAFNNKIRFNVLATYLSQILHKTNHKLTILSRGLITNASYWLYKTLTNKQLPISDRVSFEFRSNIAYNDFMNPDEFNDFLKINNII